jgi:hypothetical protein
MKNSRTKSMIFGCTSIFVFLLFISSCNIYNPSEPIPSYIHIQSIGLTTDYNTEGSSSQNVTDAWVYIDDQIIGCFELPVTFPVLSEGNHTIKIRGGIKVNGIAATRAPYPFYQQHVQTINLKKGAITDLGNSINLRYFTNVVFKLMEDFESAGFKLDTNNQGSETNLALVSGNSPNVFEGNNSGYVHLDNNKIYFRCQTTDAFTLPVASAPIFLEFNYKCDYNFTIGVIAYGSGGQQTFAALAYNASDKWKKAYLYLTPTVSGAYTANNYRIYLAMLNNSGANSVNLYLDNIKLVHF